MAYRIFFSNIGYARGIDGSLGQHLRGIGRHLYCSVPHQQQVMRQVKDIVTAETPDLCCFVEIDSGSWHSARYNQLQDLLDDEYRFHDIAGKYGADSVLARMPFYHGKSSAFMARAAVGFDRLYLRRGLKRLMYRISLPGDVQVFFAHFSLQESVRRRQFAELRHLVDAAPGEVVILADFNIMRGFAELAPLLNGTSLCVLNDESQPTFTLHTRRLALDLCICTPGIAERSALRILPQPFSDHAALLLDIQN